MVDLIYCATPSRIVKEDPQAITKIMNFVLMNGGAPFHPFQAFPYEYFEGHHLIGREKAMECCYRAVRMCNGLYVFGISEGVLGEVKVAKESSISVEFYPFLDSKWKGFYEKLKGQFGDPLEKIIENYESSSH